MNTNSPKLKPVYYSRRTLQAILICILAPCLPAEAADPSVTLNEKANGYRGIWYMNQPSGDEYVYKYSGGLGTYCAKHQPFAIYRPEVDKTFFCFGGTTTESDRQLLHMVSYYDHRTGRVPRPTVLLNKHTDDAHDNPVLSIDSQGYLWIFSTSHGRSRPSYIHRSSEPYSVDRFERVAAVRRAGDELVAIDNFSYMQAWHVDQQGFICFFTRYGDPAQRTLMCMTSEDGIEWSPWQRLAAIEQGHYQISAASPKKASSAFNYHPDGKGLNWRTNLYYIETRDFGRSWQSVERHELTLPLRGIRNPALIHDFAAEGLNVYLKDITYDEHQRPVILFLTSLGYESGPGNDPRTWRTARWTGKEWQLRDAFRSDNNYDMGSLWIADDGSWRIIAPSETGPQPYNPGGEVAVWHSLDQGQTWTRSGQITKRSPRNHTYVRRVLNAKPDFYAFWADGHGRQPSLSRLYFCDIEGQVRVLPREMAGADALPRRVDSAAD